VLLRHHLPYGAYPGWYDLVDTAGWGDKPIGVTARRRAETPEQVATLFTKCLQTADLDGLVSLYEPNVHVVAAPGVLLVGTVAIRDALRQMIDSGVRIGLEPRNIRRVDDLALVSNTATLTAATPVTSTTTQILRRQPDGGWLHILDDPFFG
jgi:ketosteroid isomerase-like protein